MRPRPHTIYDFIGTVMSDKVSKGIKGLLTDYEKHNNSTVPDIVYDAVLENAESNGAQLPVGLPVTGSTIKHLAPVLSLKDVFSKKDVNNFIQGVIKVDPDEEFLCELKYDGILMVLNYLNGSLVSAATRGDGEVGGDLTNLAKLMISVIPQHLEGDVPSELSIAGELCLNIPGFEELNENLIEANIKPYQTIRHAASGIASQKHINRSLAMYLNFIAHTLVSTSQTLGPTLTSFYHRLESYGFDTPQIIGRTSSVSEIMDIIGHESPESTYPTDGIVIKANHFKNHDRRNVKYYSGMVAYKYKEESVSTKLLGVDMSISRTGTVTPIAKLEPVELGGKTVQSTKLANQNYIDSIDLHYGDEVDVILAGGIVPWIISATRTKDSGNAVCIPNNCPECNSELVTSETNIVSCPNHTGCKAQIIGNILHFASRQGMYIKGLGDALVSKLVNEELVTSFHHLYKLTMDELFSIGLGKKTAEKLLKAIEESKQPQLSKFLYALGVSDMGIKMAQTVDKEIGSIFNILQLPYMDIKESASTKEKVLHELASPYYKTTISNLIEVGVLPTNQFNVDDIKGKLIYVSGFMPEHSLNALTSAIIRKGAIYSNTFNDEVYAVISIGLTNDDLEIIFKYPPMRVYSKDDFIDTEF